MNETAIHRGRSRLRRALLIAAALVFAVLVVYCLLPWQWRFDNPACNRGSWSACHPYH